MCGDSVYYFLSTITSDYNGTATFCPTLSVPFGLSIPHSSLSVPCQKRYCPAFWLSVPRSPAHHQGGQIVIVIRFPHVAKNLHGDTFIPRVLCPGGRQSVAFVGTGGTAERQLFKWRNLNEILVDFAVDSSSAPIGNFLLFRSSFYMSNWKLTWYFCRFFHVFVDGTDGRFVIQQTEGSVKVSIMFATVWCGLLVFSVWINVDSNVAIFHRAQVSGRDFKLHPRR